MRWLLLGILLVGGCIWGCGVEGLHSANPKTIIRLNPLSRQIEFYDSKDNDLELTDLETSPDAKLWKIGSLRITNNASKVREANVGQIDALGRQAEAIGRAWASGLVAGAELVKAGVPILGGFAPRPVWGEGQPGAAPPGWIWVGPPPATQPVGGPGDESGIEGTNGPAP